MQKDQLGSLQSDVGEREEGTWNLYQSVISRNAFLGRVMNLVLVAWERFITGEN